jgi:hypothetical protein
VEELLRREVATPQPWQALPEEAYDALPMPLPDVVIPRTIPPDPSVFSQLGPLPYARIETSLCLASLMHRTAQWVQQQIEDGPRRMDDGEGEGEGESEQPASPFEAPLEAAVKPNRNWRHKKRRWGKKH